jgi:hypothetical protein
LAETIEETKADEASANADPVDMFIVSKWLP